MQRDLDELISSKCRHSDVMSGNEKWMESVRKILETGWSCVERNGDSNSHFGSWIGIEGETIHVEDEGEDGIICVQMDQVDGRSLTTRGKTISKRRSFWNVFDVVDTNFVCCIRSAVGSGIGVTKMKCIKCRKGSQWKCRYETACGKVLSGSGIVNVNENGEIVDVGSYLGVSTDSDGDDGSGSEISESDLFYDNNDDEYPTGSAGRNGILLKCLSDAKTYASSDKVRPLYMCPAEMRLAEQLTDHIEEWRRQYGVLCFADPEGWPCGGRIRNGEGRIVKCRSSKKEGSRMLPRKITLFTLNHDLISVVVEDWVCPSCCVENRYCGEAHGIYPAAKHRAFTVEVIYFWMHEAIGKGMSFRSIFELTSNLQNTRSYRQKYENKRLDFLAPECKRDRRLANQAMGQFCSNIDLKDSSACTQTLFSCRTCEGFLGDNDFEQLGLVGKYIPYAKRFKSLVMDGKVTGALRDFPVRLDVELLVVAKGLPSKVVNNRITRTALKNLTKGLRRMIRAVEYGRGVDFSKNICLKDGEVKFRLGSVMELKGVTKGNYDEQMRIMRWYCDNTSCLCQGKNWSEQLNHRKCVKDRKLIGEKTGCDVVCDVLSQLFSISGSGEGGELVPASDLSCRVGKPTARNDECNKSVRLRRGECDDASRHDDHDDDESGRGESAGGTGALILINNGYTSRLAMHSNVRLCWNHC